MSGWQPARVFDAHHRGQGFNPAPIYDEFKWKRTAKRFAIVRIREVKRKQEWACGAERIFVIHDADSGCRGAHVCEHEILTD